MKIELTEEQKQMINMAEANHSNHVPIVKKMMVEFIESAPASSFNRHKELIVRMNDLHNILTVGNAQHAVWESRDLIICLLNTIQEYADAMDKPQIAGMYAGAECIVRMTCI